MIPPKTLKALVFATNTAWYCGAVPYRFRKGHSSHQKYQLIPSLTKSRRIFVQTSFALNVFYLCFIAFRVFQKLAADELTLPFGLQMGYLFFSYSLSVVLQVNTLIFWEEIPHFTRCYLNLFWKVKDKYLMKGESGPRCIKFFASVIIIGCLVTLQNVIIMLKKPYRPQFFTSVFDDPVRVKMVYRSPLMFLQFWIWTSTWSHIWAFCFHLYIYISCMVWTLRELDLNNKSPKTNYHLRNTRSFTKTLRSMHLLHRLWQHSHQAWFCPSHKAVAIAVGTLASYGVIKLSGPRSVIMGFVAVLCLMYLWTLFRKFGQFYEMSERLLENWMHSNRATPWMKRFLTSIPIFRIDVGSFYFVKKTTVINVVWTVLNNTITLICLE